MNREPIDLGVFAFFAAIAAPDGSKLFKTATRRVTTWDGVPPEDCPALLLLPSRERAERKKGLPTKWTGAYDLMLYVHTGAQNDPSVTPASLLNPLLDAIEAALTVDDPFDNACTLGGLVSHCAIEGDITKFLGSLGDEAVAIVPIEILTSP